VTYNNKGVDEAMIEVEKSGFVFTQENHNNNNHRKYTLYSSLNDVLNVCFPFLTRVVPSQRPLDDPEFIMAHNIIDEVNKKENELRKLFRKTSSDLSAPLPSSGRSRLSLTEERTPPRTPRQRSESLDCA